MSDNLKRYLAIKRALVTNCTRKPQPGICCNR